MNNDLGSVEISGKCTIRYQVRMAPNDSDSQRFLWRDSPDHELGVYLMQVMTLGATCSPCSAQYVTNLNANEFKEKVPRTAYAIKENHYVDDFLDSVETEEEAIKLAMDVKFIHKQAGFEMRGWISNSSRVLNALGETDRVRTKSLDMSTENPTEKVLGMHWCTTSDTFTYSLKYNRIDAHLLTGQRKPIKREVLKTLMSVFDPLGLIAHYLVHMKLILEKIWKTNIGWDEPITDRLFAKSSE